MIPREEHNEFLAHPPAPDAAARQQAGGSHRVVFEGGFCEQPPLDLVRMLGRTTYVVDDDFLIGLRWITQDVPAGGDPLARSRRRPTFRHSSYSPVQHDQRKPKEGMLLERVREARADAAILAAAKMCEPGLEEQVAYTPPSTRPASPTS